LSESLNAFELASGDPRFKNSWGNHIFMRFLPEATFPPENVNHIIIDLAKRYERNFSKLRVSTVEIVGRLKLNIKDSKPTSFRFIATNPSYCRFNSDAYVEVKDRMTKKIVLTSLSGKAPLEGHDATEPYLVPSVVDRRRVIAHQNNTTYVYDFLEVFEESLSRMWKKYCEERKEHGLEVPVIPKTLVSAKELMLDPTGERLVEVNLPPGSNKIAMVAWRVKLFTPEYKNGRTIILISNDITVNNGSFAPDEDKLFHKASVLAREKGLPRIYLAANSGARIELAKEVKEKYRIDWVDEKDPNKGFNYLFLTDEEYSNLSKLHSVNAKQVSPNCWMITDIIGVQDGLGVENLRGSGMIAGETSRAYSDVFTLTLVTGRTVGIGAYLVRLGQRAIQTKGPVILTGASALNKVLGRNVYSSNLQLGGTQIMGANGVSHLIVNDDLEGVTNILEWLAFIPRHKGAPLPMLSPSDPVDRPIGFSPTKTPYDPRHMLAGFRNAESNEWVSGFFDKGSFVEALGGWGKTVVVGRARLGGIPMGVIAVI